MSERFVKGTREAICKSCGKKKPHIKDSLKKVNICEDCFDKYQKANVTCSVCGTKHKRNSSYYNLEKPFKTCNFCSEECYTSHKLDLEEKDKMDLWLKDYYKVDTLPVLIYQQMEDYKKKQGISYKWIFRTLRYFVDVKGESLLEGTIGIVRYTHDECKEFTLNWQKTQKQANDENRKMARFSSEVIQVSEYDTNKEREQKLQKRLITEDDLEGIV